MPISALATERVPVGQLLMCASSRATGTPIGTAFAVSPHLVLTASHLITHKKSEPDFMNGVLKVAFDSLPPRKASIVTQDQPADVALLRLSKPLPRGQFPWFLIPPERLDQCAVSWVAVGYPKMLGGNPLKVSGQIAPLGLVRIPSEALPSMQLNCVENAHGIDLMQFSGSPVIWVDERGRLHLLGLFCRQLKLPSGASGRPKTSGVVFASPISHIASVLRAVIPGGLHSLALDEDVSNLLEMAEDLRGELQRLDRVARYIDHPLLTRQIGPLVERIYMSIFPPYEQEPPDTPTLLRRPLYRSDRGPRRGTSQEGP